VKLVQDDYGFQGSLPTQMVKMKINQTAKMFKILSDGIYKDKILAVIRELSCNAHDAHKAAGVKKPFKISMPVDPRLSLEASPNPTFYIEDEGGGIDPERIGEIYWTYGNSSKDQSNDYIGALGIGSKSPFAYTKSSFIVHNRWKGIEYVYMCVIDKNGEPGGALLDDPEPTTKPDGITVEFAVKNEDINAFYNRLERFFKHWDYKPEIVNSDGRKMFSKKIEKILEGDGWYLEKKEDHDSTGAMAVMGNVPYPIDIGAIPKLADSHIVIAKNPFVITFPLGALDFASSREELSYEEFTCQAISDRMEIISKDIQSRFISEIMTAKTGVEFVTSFRQKFSDFCAAITISDAGRRNFDDDHLALLTGKTREDSITFKGKEYSIEDLITGTVVLKSQTHVNFDVRSIAPRGKRMKKSISSATTLRYKFKANTKAVDFPLTGVYSTGSWDADSSAFTENWITSKVPTTVETDDPPRMAIKHSALFNIESSISFRVSEIPTVYVNDLGSSGDQRIRALVNGDADSTSLVKNYSLYLNPDHRVTTVAKALEEFKALMNEYGLDGATYTMISSLPDVRIAAEREKKERGTIVLRTLQVTKSKRQTQTVAFPGGSIKMEMPVLSKKHEREIFVLEDLVKAPHVFYVESRNSAKHCFEPGTSNSYNRTSTALISMEKRMAMLFHIGLLTAHSQASKSPEGISTSIKVMLLNDGEIEWLQKKGVKLLGLQSFMKEELIKLNAIEGFAKAYADHTMIKQVSIIESHYELISNFKEALAGTDLLEYFTQYQDASGSVQIAKHEAFALKTHLFGMFVDNNADHDARTQATKKAGLINAKLVTKYPLLAMINSLSSRGNRQAVIDYILDQNAKKSVVKTPAPQKTDVLPVEAVI
jgi:hypothetical protein